MLLNPGEGNEGLVGWAAKWPRPVSRAEEGSSRPVLQARPGLVRDGVVLGIGRLATTRAKGKAGEHLTMPVTLLQA